MPLFATCDKHLRVPASEIRQIVDSDARAKVKSVFPLLLNALIDFLPSEKLEGRGP